MFGDVFEYQSSETHFKVKTLQTESDLQCHGCSWPPVFLTFSPVLAEIWEQHGHIKENVFISIT